MRSHTFRESAIARDREGKFASKASGGNPSAISTALRDTARPDAVKDSPSRHSTGQGMPSIINGADIRTRDGKEIALDRHSDGTTTLTANGTSITLDKRATEELNRSLGDMAGEDVDVGTSQIVRYYTTGPDKQPVSHLVAHIQKDGDDSYSLRVAGDADSIEALTNTPAVNLSRNDIDKLDEALFRLDSSSRVPTDYGDIDVYPTDDGKIAFRHLGDDGTPVETAFNAASIARIRRAIDVVIEGFDEDSPDGPDTGVRRREVSTNAGKVRIELDGEWGGTGSGNVLRVTPATGDAWGVVVDGPNQSAFYDAIDRAEEAWIDN
ncbi:hypothetical protein [Nonomuraea wenchangensis]|uniref:Uncharacterized protein n=1 Tax=Nonomuraea wenchangensis TaxID=568860 RepID=A0A1I0ET31_9ACTN|nr:hypothetical protein [Nonomuraea wenchangensis]SET48711.1 hypothetical protein SAMN05421811_103194 [Nonomuraea wenchangensis]